jgi:outer membrane protein assembly factor BamE (lipoprotein component of BamABCDE complex)
MYNKRILITGLLFSAILLIIVISACSKKKIQNIVYIDDRVITTDRLMYSVPHEMWDYISKDDKNAVLDRIIEQDILVMEMQRRKLSDNPAII